MAKDKRSRLNNSIKIFLSAQCSQVGQQEKGSGNRTIIGQREIRNGLRQEGEESEGKEEINGGKDVGKTKKVKRKKVVLNEDESELHL